MTQRLRSMLFAPGNKSELLEKFSKIQPDAAVIDLEDAVPDTEKTEARKNLQKYGSAVEGRGFALFTRVNPISTGYFELDIQAVPPEIDGVIIPKVSSVEELDEAQIIFSRNSVEANIVVGIEITNGNG